MRLEAEMTLTKISQKELEEHLQLHAFWLNNTLGSPNFESGIRFDFDGIDIKNTDLQGVNLQFAFLQYSDLSNVNFQNADLRSSYLRSSNLRGVNFQDAKLENADFRFTDLRGTQFEHFLPHTCDIRGSKWLRSDLPWWLGHPQQDQIVLYED